MNKGAELESRTESISGMDFTEIKNKSWHTEPAVLRKKCSQKCSVFKTSGPTFVADGRKTRKLMAYCKKRVNSGGTLEAALLNALITAAQKKAAVIRKTPRYRLRQEAGDVIRTADGFPDSLLPRLHPGSARYGGMSACTDRNKSVIIGEQSTFDNLPVGDFGRTAAAVAREC